MASGSWAQRPPDNPANAGNKEEPKGHPDCLAGLAFVISGVLDSLRREQAEDLIKRHGGRVTGNVSRKTTFLLVGMECGNSKLNKAKECNVRLIDEDGLFSLIAAAPAADTPTPAAPAAAPAAAPVKPAPATSRRGTDTRHRRLLCCAQAGGCHCGRGAIHRGRRALAAVGGPLQAHQHT